MDRCVRRPGHDRRRAPLCEPQLQHVHLQEHFHYKYFCSDSLVGSPLSCKKKLFNYKFLYYSSVQDAIAGRRRAHWEARFAKARQEEEEVSRVRKLFIYTGRHMRK